MKENKIDNSLALVRISYILVMLSMTFQLFTRVPILQRHYLFWGLTIFIAMIYANGFFKTKAFVWMTLYLFVVLLNFMVGDSLFDSNRVIMEFIAFFIPSTLTYYFFRQKDKVLIKLLVIFFGVFLIESTIVSAYANSIIPEIMRLQSSATAATANAYILEPFVKIGLSNYILPHAIPVIIPGLVYVYGVSKGWMKYFYALVLIAAWGLAYVSCSFTAIMVATISSFLSLMVSRRDSKKSIRRIVITALLVTPVAFSSSIQLSILKSIDSIVPVDNIVSRKIQDLEMSVVFGDAEGGLQQRQEKYDMTIEAIQKNIVIGVDDAILGDHSSLLDRLGALGLVGMIPYFLFLFCQLKSIARYLGNTQRLYFYIAIGCALIMLLLKNSSYWAMWFLLFSLLPGLLWAGDAGESKTIAKEKWICR